MELTYPKTKAEAREQAIEWQQWQSEQSLSYGEIIPYIEYFTKTAKEFDLVDEFKENGII